MILGSNGGLLIKTDKYDHPIFQTEPVEVQIEIRTLEHSIKSTWGVVRTFPLLLYNLNYHPSQFESAYVPMTYPDAVSGQGIPGGGCRGPIIPVDVC